MLVIQLVVEKVGMLAVKFLYKGELFSGEINLKNSFLFVTNLVFWRLRNCVLSQ